MAQTGNNRRRQGNPLGRMTRTGFAISLGTINMFGEAISNPSGWVRGLERRGERVMDQLERNNAVLRRSVSLLRRRAGETADSARSSVSATLGVAETVSGAAEDSRTRRRAGAAAGSRRRTATRSRAKARAKNTTASAKTGARKAVSSARVRVSRATKAAAHEAGDGRSSSRRKVRTAAGAAKKATTTSRRRATGTARQAESVFKRTADRVESGVENLGERIEGALESIAS